MVSFAKKLMSCIVFRVDASLEIGTGHVMRCLTLAQALRHIGAECHFVCREHRGNLIDFIKTQDFIVHRLPMPDDGSKSLSSEEINEPSHAHWLGVSWQTDAEACRAYIEALSPDWLVVDHYAIDSRWEAFVCPHNTRLLVIDDLADRKHLSDMLLDQNLGREAEDYMALVPMCCRSFIGSEFALLRPEFAQWRDVSLARRCQSMELRKLLISLGGVDKDNVTGQVLEALKHCDLPDGCKISVIMGATAPWLNEVKVQASTLPWPTEVVVNVSDMARRMSEADLAIGAAGSTSWERCCLGLPTLMLVLADNQRAIAEALNRAGAAVFLDSVNTRDISRNVNALLERGGVWKMSKAAASLTTGQGVDLLCHVLLQQSENA
ncbi:UDP-2,4-diacetamido-2,4,6-trideoxy-beta-L-altropyranose hydrolase [Vreelandella titanicae]|uniref:UDP-2,4-diacetamido-2,4, 6-trideoxy-beta-L-altropyranose hydrolase n=1 Tax=Vreelandella titanicae TaxID=664683 RepID=UPI001680C072|nr:UDP-2,4-diacetamido-2,4,6-trideoxy-beta-L-altropyranose hydrolase [Halomonas titanicae]QNU64511.1 UDP-2,4-diacetamido-2,4,6-trideoxy-beta-L-altropyranose hydrolase [Halomonas titanicae]